MKKVFRSIARVINSTRTVEGGGSLFDLISLRFSLCVHVCMYLYVYVCMYVCVYVLCM